MKVQRITASQHVLNDRSNRLTFILTHTDLSDLTVLLEQRYPDKRECREFAGWRYLKRRF